MGLEVTNIRRRLSTAAVRAASTVLLARISQVGQGSGLASRRREWQRREEMEIQNAREADFLVHCTGREISLYQLGYLPHKYSPYSTFNQFSFYG